MGQYLKLCHARFVPHNFLFIRHSRGTFDDFSNLEFSDSLEIHLINIFLIELCGHLGF